MYRLLLVIFCNAAPMEAPQPIQREFADCSTLAGEMQEFASKLTIESKKMMFCSNFNDGQRLQAMQIAGRMTPDQAVDKVAAENNLIPPATQKKTPGGCPVK
jgi:hypothetical protein